MTKQIITVTFFVFLIFPAILAFAEDDIIEPLIKDLLDENSQINVPNPCEDIVSEPRNGYKLREIVVGQNSNNYITLTLISVKPSCKLL